MRAALLLVLFPGVAWAWSTGVAGYSGKKPGYSCRDCHVMASSEPASVVISGPTTLNANERAAFTIAVTGPDSRLRDFAGMAVAASEGDVREPANYPDGGTSFVKEWQHEGAYEVSHATPMGKTATNTFPFDFVAPPWGGTVTLHGCGVSSNKTGSALDDGGKHTTFTVTISGPARPPDMTVPPDLAVPADMSAVAATDDLAAPEPADMTPEPPPASGCGYAGAARNGLGLIALIVALMVLRRRG